MDTTDGTNQSSLPGFSGGGNLVNGANWEASVGSSSIRGASASTSRLPTSHRAGQMSPRNTPPKKTCRSVTAAVLQGGQLNFSNIDIPDFLIPDSQESVICRC